MVQANRLKKVIVITGPTAVGKTDISLEIARLYKTEIINADASQFRKDLNIGTAKIDLSKTNIKHHLLNIISPTEDFSIKDFQKIGREKIEEISNRGKIPLVIGGSGLYISALLGDYDLSNLGRSQNIDDKYQHLSNIELHQVLEKMDYKTAQLVHYNNRRRVLRYIEILEKGDLITTKQNGKDLLYDALIIVLNTDRDILYKRIEQRVDLMFDEGWIEEVKSLINKNIDINLIKEIGYKEILQYLENKESYQELLEKIKKDSRHYAKRQLTWFKNKFDSHIVTMNYIDTFQTIKEIHNLIKKFIEKDV